MSMIEPEDIAKWQKQQENELFEVKELKTPVFDDNGVEIAEPKYWFVCCKQKGSLSFKCADYEAAVELCAFLNNEAIFNVGTGIDSYVLDNCREWSNIIDRLSEAEKELYSKKESYEKESESLLEDAAALKAATGEDIIKAKYGGNNEKTRRKYVKDSLLDKKLEIKQLEFKLDYYKRRISYLKGLVTVKTALLGVKDND